MIVVLGSINIDQIYHVDQLPTPGETRMGKGYLQVPGGKGANQALAARRAGADVVMVGAVGRDNNAQAALSLMAKDGVRLDKLKISSNPTGSASIWVGENAENSIIVNGGANMDVSADQLSDDILKDATYLMMQMEIPAEEVSEAAKMAKSAGVKTILNLAPYQDVDLSLFQHIDILVVNETEARNIAHKVSANTDSYEDMCMQLSVDLSLTCVLTMGEKGVCYLQDNLILQIPANKVSAVDTTAAGDCFCGYLVADLDAGNTIKTAIEKANKAASLSCMVEGSQNSVPWKTDI
ncbi:ribokinase [Sneathiella sp. P13V-1]|uniref:ribokinase n=1 Tax=Sneathiella sp. P13V-1 TaxID=2697366 RepID=UPI00187B57C3|nr:ribokinase [Sneathiella sp. P13V-1]MBE7637269.1 ribokinase [Sneathiella sp. P13V-1]